MRHAAIARERGMNESTVRSILKRKDHIKKLVDRTPHWSPTMVRKISHFITHCWKDYSQKKNDQLTSQIQILKILC